MNILIDNCLQIIVYSDVSKGYRCKESNICLNICTNIISDNGPQMNVVARRLVLLTKKLVHKQPPNTYLHSGTDIDVETVWRDVANSTDEYVSVAEYFHEAFTELVMEAVKSEPDCDALFAELKDPVR